MLLPLCAIAHGLVVSCGVHSAETWKAVYHECWLMDSTDCLNFPPHNLSTCTELLIAWHLDTESQEIEASSSRKAWTQKCQSITEPHPVGQGKSPSQPTFQERSREIVLAVPGGAQESREEGLAGEHIGDYLLHNLWTHVRPLLLRLCECTWMSFRVKNGFLLLLCSYFVAGSFFQMKCFTD